MRKRKSSGGSASLPGSQTLWRALNIIEAVADGATKPADLAATVKLTRSTTHRLAAALVDRRYLGLNPGVGYFLGPKLLELGYQAKDRADLPKVARSHLEGLAARSGDAVHLGVRDGQHVLYLDKVSGGRRIEFRSRIGERMPLRSTGLGKALLLDGDEAEWRMVYAADEPKGKAKGTQVFPVDLDTWLARMREYARHGYAFDLEENEDHVRCVAAPVRDAAGEIAASVSVASAAQYMSDDRMRILIRDVRDTAAAISRDLGWRHDLGAKVLAGKMTR
ncbi:MAG: IclR family transcriptional regulator [Rhodospirillaceae bacterium]